MYKIPNVPPREADIHEIADYVEIECIKNKGVSSRAILSNMNLLIDHDYRDGVPEDEEMEPKISDTLTEIKRRHQFCGNKYPFAIGRHGHVVQLNPGIAENIREVYTFLLFATRLNMMAQRIQNDIDGALLFEELSEFVGKYYFGERAESYLFGTASTGSNFSQKITSLIKRMGEGGEFKNRNETTKSLNKDDGLDIVVWKSFSDGYPGKLIGFGQCKTGTYWNVKRDALQPDSFCQKWFADQPAVKPVRLFFISESILRNRWYEHASSGGILFDRCRIMDYFPMEKKPPFLSQIKRWNKAVIENVL